MPRLDPSLEPNGSGLSRIEVIIGAGGRRRWSEAEKALAVENRSLPMRPSRRSRVDMALCHSNSSPGEGARAGGAEAEGAPPSPISCISCWVMLNVRDAIPKRRDLAKAQFATLRLRLIKIAAVVIETASRVRLAFAACCPEADLFRSVPAALMPSSP